MVYFFFFKQKTAYEITTGDWSSDVCSSDLRGDDVLLGRRNGVHRGEPPPAPVPCRAGERDGGGVPRGVPPAGARALDRDDGRHGRARRRRVRGDVEPP